MQFEPFLDRFSRIIRNDLGATIDEVIAEHDIAPAQTVADKYLGMDVDRCYREYILERLSRYAAAVQQLGNIKKDTINQALVLWDQGLFFEVHEVLEHAWIRASGSEKEILQALIRAAGVYIKLEYGYTEAAKKIAAKALPVLQANRGYLNSYFEPDTLVKALQDVSLPPPQLSKAEPDSGG